MNMKIPISPPPDWVYLLSATKLLLKTDQVQWLSLQPNSENTYSLTVCQLGHVVPGVVVCLLLRIIVGRVKKQGRQ